MFDSATRTLSRVSQSRPIKDFFPFFAITIRAFLIFRLPNCTSTLLKHSMFSGFPVLSTNSSLFGSGLTNVTSLFTTFRISSSGNIVIGDTDHRGKCLFIYASFQHKRRITSAVQSHNCMVVVPI